jgi:glycosyltransferase involved in cell wall biosynthesis
MKISIITTTLNSEKTLPYTLSSVFEQTYKKIEHIIVDGGSTDKTLDIIKKHKVKNKKFFYYKKSSIYEALNLGIKKSTGDYVLILNSDDILEASNTIEKVTRFLQNKSKDLIVLGSVTYFNNNEFNKINRYYSPKKFNPWMMIFGSMPPHPGAFTPISIAKNNLYNKEFSIAADFDFFLRTLYLKKYRYQIIRLNITRMKTGGISGKNLLSHLKSSNEIFRSLKINKIYSNILFIYLRFLIKILQIYVFSRKVKNKYKINNYYKKLIKFDFKILTNIKKLDWGKNFVLSALNLAFLGSMFVKEVRLYKELIHWPDGIFAKKISTSLNKTPGRMILGNLKINQNIKRIIVLGNLHNTSRNYLKRKFNKPIINYPLFYGDIKKIIKDFKFKIKKQDLCFITLPTPKQEQLAEFIALKSKNFKIICIGGSLNIASGVEIEVPKLLQKYEFIWRLRYETSRRLVRLIKTFYHYLLGKYIFKIYNDKTYEILK